MSARTAPYDARTATHRQPAQPAGLQCAVGVRGRDDRRRWGDLPSPTTTAAGHPSPATPTRYATPSTWPKFPPTLRPWLRRTPPSSASARTTAGPSAPPLHTHDETRRA